MKHLLLLFTTLFLAGCAASVGKLATPSGKPEVTIAGKTTKQVLDAIAAWSPTKGFLVENATEYGMTTTGSAELDIDFFGSTTSVKATNNYTVAKNDNAVTIYLIQFRTYRRNMYGQYDASGVESTKEYNSQDAYDELQLELEKLRVFIQAK